eukprot:284817661_5
MSLETHGKFFPRVSVSVSTSSRVQINFLTRTLPESRRRPCRLTPFITLRDNGWIDGKFVPLLLSLLVEGSATTSGSPGPRSSLTPDRNMNTPMIMYPNRCAFTFINGCQSGKGLGQITCPKIWVYKRACRTASKNRRLYVFVHTNFYIPAPSWSFNYIYHLHISQKMTRNSANIAAQQRSSRCDCPCDSPPAHPMTQDLPSCIIHRGVVGQTETTLEAAETTSGGYRPRCRKQRTLKLVTKKQTSLWRTPRDRLECLHSGHESPEKPIHPQAMSAVLQHFSSRRVCHRNTRVHMWISSDSFSLLMTRSCCRRLRFGRAEATRTEVNRRVKKESHRNFLPEGGPAAFRPLHNTNIDCSHALKLQRATKNVNTAKIHRNMDRETGINTPEDALSHKSFAVMKLLFDNSAQHLSSCHGRSAYLIQGNDRLQRQTNLFLDFQSISFWAQCRKTDILPSVSPWREPRTEKTRKSYRRVKGIGAIFDWAGRLKAVAIQTSVKSSSDICCQLLHPRYRDSRSRRDREAQNKPIQASPLEPLPHQHRPVVVCSSVPTSHRAASLKRATCCPHMCRLDPVAKRCSHGLPAPWERSAMKHKRPATMQLRTSACQSVGPESICEISESGNTAEQVVLTLRCTQAVQIPPRRHQNLSHLIGASPA